ncbi:dolichyl-phosphate beta-transferase [Grosmannia clavigera kw1407]|uniref:dolichyl-phosphate beta-glucosyltransferase n=1 Tax=Grosmannia clavigera (strain kw1407 / UAMH 11150) TaxID=655863 RepID=F0XHX2_GROCL|nr:dolichyl-phosphate beta-transferase [Grosmannia clavigera kw1407]EFX02688.1 dolichyl-phosphate beta-transferase [Grosmannia clavigera kw1407]
MADALALMSELPGALYGMLSAMSLPALLALMTGSLLLMVAGAYVILCQAAPLPRLSLPSEKTYRTSDRAGVAVTRQLPCWYDKWLAERHLAAGETAGETTDSGYDLNAIEPAEVALTVVVPAYNEALRILPALEEMVEYCDRRFGRTAAAADKTASGVVLAPTTGYEILIIDDASSDGTAEVVLDYGQQHGLHDVLRVIRLARNRGKGGGVTHGFRHARGMHIVFADADGASRFGDLDRLLEGCAMVVDASGRGVAIGSRAHLVGSEAVVRRSALRNFLMKSFHFVLTILTPPATSRIRDTQCGFKLFSRPALPHIVPYMHTEGWIFDIEMLMLAESAPATPVVAHDGTVIGTSPGIKVAEVPIHWHEVDGSKMNLVQDSIRMAIGLTVLRASWMLGVYRRRLA